MVNHLWQQGQAVIVTVTGPGKIHFLSYASTVHPSMVGTVEARPEGKTRFLVAFSYGFFKYALHWDGAGDTVASFGPVIRAPVGKGWNEALFVEWGSSNFAYKDVTSDATAAGVNPDVPCFVIPEL